MMAKRPPAQSPPPALFPNALARRRRPAKALFLPKFLARDAKSVALTGPAFDHARATITRWAALEANGGLRVKETGLDAQFLLEVFGDALGYKGQTQSPDSYGVVRNFTVEGVGTADGALGEFPHGKAWAMIELKGADTDLDRDRSNGRTAVQQLWDYLNARPECPWGILSNFSTIRLYHRDRTPRAYQEFSLQDLLHADRFAEFYHILERGGLLPTALGEPRALRLLNETANRQRTVGDDLYELYRHHRSDLIAHLHLERGRPLDAAIHAAQLLIDRVIFIAFCEDRGLLPPGTIEAAYNAVHPLSPATARFRSFLDLFRAMDKGHPGIQLETGYNGGLFRHDPEVDTLELPDVPWATFFQSIGRYDFRDEVNVDVLGQLFEKSIVELEKLRVGGLFGFHAPNGNGSRNGNGTAKGKGKPKAATKSGIVDSAMPKSAQRKLFGVYYTPPEFTDLLVRETVDATIEARLAALEEVHGVKREGRDERRDTPEWLAFWRAARSAVESLRVVDPACGSGAFLIRAYDSFEQAYREIADGLLAAKDPGVVAFDDSVPDLILNHNLFGVDLSAEAVEIAQLALWIRSARPNRTLANLSANIVCGNSLVSDPEVHTRAMVWRDVFPEVFAAGGFDCVIGNPPWERAKVQEREFFARFDPATAQAVSAADRRKRIAAMEAGNPDLFAAYTRAQADAEKMLQYARSSGRYPFTGKGDINLYTLFAELATAIVAPGGLVGLLTPSGIATDDSTKEFFSELMDRKGIRLLYDFENHKPWFPDVHRAFKFTAMVSGGVERSFETTDFVFYARAFEELAQRKRHIPLNAADLKLLNPNTRTCPIFRTRRDAELTRGVYRRVPVLIDHGREAGGNPWGLRFLRMFDQTNDAELFERGSALEKRGYRLAGNVYRKGKSVFLPVYEAKMVQAFDHRAASVVVEEENWVRQGQKEETSDVQHQNPEHVVLPRFWVEEKEVAERFDGAAPAHGLIGFKDITSPTNERTMIASAAPLAGFTNHFVLLRSDAEPRRLLCLLANLNAMALDYITRQKIGGVTLNFFIVEQLPVLPPDAYTDKRPWTKRATLERWVSDRVLKLTCTADDMKPLAEACGFEGSLGGGVHKWKSQERLDFMAELDAAFFHLYGFEREDVEYVLGTFTGTRAEADGGDHTTDQRRRMILEHFDGLATMR